MQVKKIPAAMRNLLAGAIDYAGLFPPAALSLEAAARNYSDYRVGRHSWMLGRFIVPAPRLSELQHQLEAIPESTPWKISALVGQNYQSEFDCIRAFNHDNAHRAVVDATEASRELHNKVEDVVAAAPAGNRAYFEVPLDATVDQLRTIHRSGARAKVRTGGLVPQAIPPAPDLARFIVNCATAGVAFKATAGLHHPIRCLKPLTYEANAPEAEMHGFVNLLFAGALAMQGASVEALGNVLSEKDASSFMFTESRARWLGKSVSTKKLYDAREQLVTSFGSCSFEEPVEDLGALEWL